MNSFNFALCLTPRRVAGGGGPGLVRLCVSARPFTKTKGSGQTKSERLLYCIGPLVFSLRPLKIISAHWVDPGLKKNLEIISAQWVDSGFAKIKLKLIAPNGWISAFGQVKNFIGINSAQWVEWRIKKLLILAGRCEVRCLGSVLLCGV